MAEHNDDLVACAVATRGLVNGSDAMGQVTAATGGGLLGAIVGGVIDNNENRQGQAANMENCMALRGWSVIGLTEEEGKALEAWDDDPARLREELAVLVEAASAQGVVLRGPFANELAVGNFRVGEAGDLEEVSLSRRAVKDMTDAAVEAAGEINPPKLPKGVKAPDSIKTVREKDINLISADKAQIVLSMTGKRTALDINSLILQRLGEDGAEIVYDGEPVSFLFNGAKIRKTTEGDIRRYDFIAEIPPGIWKIAAINWGAFAADLCFGAPAFAIQDGETLFLGTLNIREDGGYPLDQSDLSVAQDILEPLPELKARVKFAALTNGFTSDCFGSYAYAYHQPGAPFVDGEPDEDTIAVEIVNDPVTQ
ncbi:hypothetical protein [Hyphococcus sp.]|uniref:hypothetical protein n=1 Tax=Hyphococcus sp. TaxID=2038636 RepID=UPI003D0E2E24